MNVDEQSLRDALRAVADEGGAPDESTAWRNITAGIAVDARRRRRARALFAGGAVALTGAAAALVVAGDDDARPEAVESGPAASPDDVVDEEPTVPENPATSVPLTVDTATTLPPDTSEDDPVEDALEPPPDGAILTVTDAGLEVRDRTGGVVWLAFPAEDFGANGPTDATIAPDGTLWYAFEYGDSDAVRRQAWGDAEATEPFGTESSSPALSPDGSTLAFVRGGVTLEQDSIVLVDLASGDETTYTWSAGNEDFFRTQGTLGDLDWSPDGTRLLATSAYEGSELLVYDVATMTSLDDADSPFAVDAFDADWLTDDQIVVLDGCCYPDHDQRVVRVLSTSGADPVDVDSQGRVPVSVDGASSGVVGVLDEDGTLTVGLPDDAVVVEGVLRFDL